MNNENVQALTASRSHSFTDPGNPRWRSILHTVPWGGEILFLIELLAQAKVDRQAAAMDDKEAKKKYDRPEND